jgi:WD40 repeat protein
MGYEIWAVPPGASPLKSDFTYTSEGKSCRFGSDGSYAVGDLGGKTRYYLSNFNIQWINTLTAGSTPSIESLAFSPNGSLFAVGTSILQNIYSFNYLSSNASTIRYFRDDPIISLDYSEDGVYLASG